MPDNDLQQVKSFSLFIIGVVAVIFVGVFVLAVIAASNSSAGLLVWWAALVTALLFPVGMVGFFLGKLEARGTVNAYDKSSETFSKSVAPLVGAMMGLFRTLEITSESRAKRIVDEQGRAISAAPLGNAVEFDIPQVIDGQANRLDM